jgi:hypothetical protein
MPPPLFPTPPNRAPDAPTRPALTGRDTPAKVIARPGRKAATAAAAHLVRHTINRPAQRNACESIEPSIIGALAGRHRPGDIL